MWASATLEDLDGAVEVLFFPRTYETVAEHLADDQVVAVRGKVNRRDSGSVSVIAFDMAVLDISAVAVAGGRPVTLRVRDTAVTETSVDRLKEVLTQHKGDTEVRIELSYASQRPADLLRVANHRVQVSPALMTDLKALLGAGNVL